MKLERRHAILGGVGLVAAGAGVIGLATRQPDETMETPTVVAADETEICLDADIAFLPGDQAGCFKRSEFAKWEAAPLVDPERGAIVVSMSHPTDASRDAAQCATCRDFRELRFDGWYASTSRDMRREAFFTRACGVLSALRGAEAATITYFGETGLEAGEVASLAADRLLRVGADPAAAPGDPEIVQTAPASWRISAGGQTVRIDEVALADFDGDNIAEILAVFITGPDDATARIADAALLEKDAAGAALTVTPLDSPSKNQAKNRI